MNIEEIQKKVLKIIRMTGRNDKYLRNLTLYTETPISSLDNVDEIVGYYNTTSNKTSLIQQNIIQSTILALVAKLAEHARARPFINTLNGNYIDKQITRATQQYLDVTFDEQNVYQTVSEVFRDACIFDTGYIFVDRDNEKVCRVFPWQVYYDNKELRYTDKPTQVAIVKKQYPVTLLDPKLYSKYRREYVTFIQYWNLNEHKQYNLIKEIPEYVKVVEYEPDVLPILRLTYDSSVNGAGTSTSVVDLLYGIQKTVNELCIKMGKAIRLNPATQIFVPTNGSIDADKITNEVNQIIPFEPAIGASTPIQQVTPSLFDPSLRTELEALKRDAYELVGISELSVTGQRPTDDVSGVALKTMENQEADRFTTQLHKIIRLYVDIANLMISIYPDNKQILPNIKERLDFTWKDVRNSREKMKLQFSAAANISKDPSEKWKIIKEWKAEGLIPVNRVPGLLEIPDLEEAASFAANSYNAIQSVISDCIKNDNYDIPQYISREELKPEIMNTCLMLKGLGPENDKDIAKLEKLFEIVVNEEAAVGKATQTDEANAALDNEANAMDEQSAFLEMQAQQLTGLAQDAQNGILSIDQVNSQLETLGAGGQFDYAGV
jgi:hypothetical protein